MSTKTNRQSVDRPPSSTSPTVVSISGDVLLEALLAREILAEAIAAYDLSVRNYEGLSNNDYAIARTIKKLCGLTTQRSPAPIIADFKAMTEYGVLPSGYETIRMADVGYGDSKRHGLYPVAPMSKTKAYALIAKHHHFPTSEAAAKYIKRHYVVTAPSGTD